MAEEIGGRIVPLSGIMPVARLIHYTTSSRRAISRRPRRVEDFPGILSTAQIAILWLRTVLRDHIIKVSTITEKKQTTIGGYGVTGYGDAHFFCLQGPEPQSDAPYFLFTRIRTFHRRARKRSRAEIRGSGLECPGRWQRWSAHSPGTTPPR